VTDALYDTGCRLCGSSKIDTVLRQHAFYSNPGARGCVECWTACGCAWRDFDREITRRLSLQKPEARFKVGDRVIWHSGAYRTDFEGTIDWIRGDQIHALIDDKTLGFTGTATSFRPARDDARQDEGVQMGRYPIGMLGCDGCARPVHAGRALCDECEGSKVADKYAEHMQKRIRGELPRIISMSSFTSPFVPELKAIDGLTGEELDAALAHNANQRRLEREAQLLNQRAIQRSAVLAGMGSDSIDRPCPPRFPNPVHEVACGMVRTEARVSWFGGEGQPWELDD